MLSNAEERKIKNVATGAYEQLKCVLRGDINKEKIKEIMRKLEIWGCHP